jgi:DNA-binding transcriptional LysR family regulator
MNEQRLTWDDLRTVSAIVRGGSLVAAARAVNVSHTTVFRRLGEIEARLGVKLFSRAHRLRADRRR